MMLFGALLLLATVAASQNVSSNSSSSLIASREPMQMINFKHPDSSRQEANFNESSLVESVNERRVKESQLLAEESRQDDSQASILPAPANLQSISSRQPNFHEQDQKSFISFAGGSGNSYTSLARDGSKRYRFGYDTASSPGRAGRLMREESRLADGTVIGRYGYTDPFNVFRIVQYVAGADGYFASEQVGALLDQTIAPSRVQLNKQLLKAFEQVRAQRANRQPASQAGTRTSEGVQKFNEKLSEEPELLASSASQTVANYATTINHVTGHDGLSYATAFRPSMDRSRSQLPKPVYPPSGLYSTSSGLARAAPLAPPPTAPPQRAPVLQTSSAWTLLHNNYLNLPASDRFQNSLLIDHSQGSVAAGPRIQLTRRMGEEFEQQAQTLRSIRARQLEQQAPQSVAQHNKQVLESQRFGHEQHHRPATITPAEPNLHFRQPPIATNFGMSYDSDKHSSNDLTSVYQHFGTRTSPLGSAENLSSSNFAGLALQHFDAPLYHPEVHETKPVVYASTVVHSQVVAEQDYKPERLQAQEVAQIQPDHRQLSAGQPFEHKYATRLSGAISGLRLGSADDLSVDDSEQVLAYSNSTANRAKIPDRSRKLSSIFKARGQAGSAAGTSGASAPAKIRKPMPIGAKKETLVVPEATSVTTTEELRNETSESIQLDKVDASKSSAEMHSMKKFGKSANSVAEVQSSIIQEDSVVVAPAKRRPLLRESTTTSTSTSTTTSTTTTTTTTSTTTPAPSMNTLTLSSADVLSESPLIESSLTETNSEHATASKEHFHDHYEQPESISKATIVDASKVADPEFMSAFDPDLYEKIVRIQQEIRERASNITADLNSTTSFSSNSKETVHEESVNTTMSPTTTPPATTTTTTTTTISTPTTQMHTIGLSMPVTDTALAEVTTFNLTSEIAPETTTNFIPSTSLPNTRTSTTQPTTTQPTISTTSTSTSTSTSTTIAATTTVNQNLISTTSTTSTLAPTTSTEQLDNLRSRQEVVSTPSLVTKLPEVSKNTSSAPEVAKVEYEHDVSKGQLLTGPLLTMNLDQNEFLARLTQDMDSFDSGRVEVTSRQPQELLVEVASSAPDFSTSTTSSTSTSPARSTSPMPTSTSTATSTSTHKPRRVSTNQPRFGRLVIKRGDKVVAKFNASEPIPDSMIPVAGSGDVIVPDMPRLAAMRRLKVNRTRDGQQDARPLARRSLYRGARSAHREQQPREWSARLREVPMNGTHSAKIRYDPKEELRKLVEKIKKIESRSVLRKGEPPHELIVNSMPVNTSLQANVSSQLNLYAGREFNQTAMDLVQMRPEVEKVVNKTVSSSIAFTVPLASSVASLAARRLSDRMDSHGHIQVRNNQSITVQVDIEPPRDAPSTNNLSLQHKRLFSRDTSNHLMTATLKSTSIDHQQQVEATARISKRPRMLCVEVEQEQRAQKVANLVQAHAPFVSDHTV